MLAPLRLVLIVGVGGSGKSWLGRGIRQRLRNLDYLFVDTEEIKRSVGNNAMIAEKTASHDAAYAAIYDAAINLLKINRSVVLDTPHNLEMRDPEFMPRLINRLREERINAVIPIIWMRVTEENLRRVMQKRRREADLWKLDNWDRFKAEELDIFQVPHPHLEIWNPGFDFNAVIDYILSKEHQLGTADILTQASSSSTHSTLRPAEMSVV